MFKACFSCLHGEPTVNTGVPAAQVSGSEQHTAPDAVPDASAQHETAARDASKGPSRAVPADPSVATVGGRTSPSPTASASQTANILLGTSTSIANDPQLAGLASPWLHGTGGAAGSQQGGQARTLVDAFLDSERAITQGRGSGSDGTSRPMGMRDSSGNPGGFSLEVGHVYPCACTPALQVQGFHVAPCMIVKTVLQMPHSNIAGKSPCHCPFLLMLPSTSSTSCGPPTQRAAAALFHL